MLRFGVGGLHLHGKASLLGAHDPSSLGEDLVFSPADGVIADRLALKKN
jgi:hypothetical protein